MPATEAVIESGESWLYIVGLWGGIEFGIGGVPCGRTEGLRLDALVL